MGNSHKTKSPAPCRPSKLVPLRSRAEACRCLVYQWFALSQWLPVQCDRDVVRTIACYLACLADPFLFLSDCASLDFATYCYVPMPGRSPQPIRFRQACMQGIPAHWRCETWLRLMENDLPSVRDPAARQSALEKMQTEYWETAKAVSSPYPQQDHSQSLALRCIGKDVSRTHCHPIFSIPATKRALTRVLAVACCAVSKPDSDARQPISIAKGENHRLDCYGSGMCMMASMFMLCSVQARFSRSSCASSTVAPISKSVQEDKDDPSKQSPFSMKKGFLELLHGADDPCVWCDSNEAGPASEYFEALMTSDDEEAIKLREDVEFDTYRLFSLWLHKLGVYFFEPDNTLKLLEQMDVLLRYSEVGFEKTLLKKFDDIGISMTHFYRWVALGLIADLPTSEVMKYWDAILSVFESGRSMDLVMYLCTCILSKRTHFMRGDDEDEMLSLTDLTPMTQVWRSNDYRDALDTAYHLFSLDVVHSLGPDAAPRK